MQWLFYFHCFFIVLGLALRCKSYMAQPGAQAGLRKSAQPLSFNVSLLMTRIRAFQILVVASALLYLAWMLLPHSPQAYSHDVQQILAWSSYGSAQWYTDPRFYISIGVGKIVSSIGLFLFLSWGRWLLLAVVVISMAAVPFAGVSVSMPFDSIIGGFLSLSDGAILALAFFSPLAEAMRRDE
jgi:hypothetical protein